MIIKNAVFDFAITFVIALVAAAATTFVYESIAHGEGVVGWTTSLFLATVLGVIVAIVNARARRVKAANR